MTSLVIALYVLGGGLPVVGLVVAYVRVTTSYREAKREREFRAELMGRMHAAIEEHMRQSSTDVAGLEAITAQFMQEAKDAGYPLMTVGEFDSTVGTVDPSAIASAAREARWGLWLVGTGIVLTTVASILSLGL
jgi:hypothetical protein